MKKDLEKWNNYYKGIPEVEINNYKIWTLPLGKYHFKVKNLNIL